MNYALLVVRITLAADLVVGLLYLVDRWVR